MQNVLEYSIEQEESERHTNMALDLIQSLLLKKDLSPSAVIEGFNKTWKRLSDVGQTSTILHCNGLPFLFPLSFQIILDDLAYNYGCFIVDLFSVNGR